MYLVTSATEMEMAPFVRACQNHDPRYRLITGVGPLESTYSLTRRLAEDRSGIRGVLNFGVAGAYPLVNGVVGAELLDICVAELECMGDLGICFDDRIEAFAGEHVPVRTRFPVDQDLADQAAGVLAEAGITCHRGVFVTVCSVSGTAGRGEIVAAGQGGLCENMEGAAVAGVCDAFNLPLLELRCISNFVEDRDVSRWRLGEACEKAGMAAALVLRALG